MGRRRKGGKVDGWLVLDKPAGLSSAQAVTRVRRLFDAQKAGHAGTLDPLATGVLPIGLGEATKTMPWIVDSAKGYDFTLAWGEARDTDDAEGAVVETSDITPSREEILAVLPRFSGEIEQVPPVFSALKIAGKRAYDLARSGETPELAARRVRIDALAVLDHDTERRQSRFSVACSKGTYIRSLARDIARAAGGCGYVAALRRTRVGPFREDDAISLEMLEELGHGPAASARVLAVTTALDDIPALAVTEPEADRLLHGQAIRNPAAKDGTLCAMCNDRPIAIVAVEHGAVRPLRVFDL